MKSMLMPFRRFQLSSSIFIAAALLLAGVAPSVPAADENVKIVTIGFAGPLTGPSAAMGKSQQHAVELALHEANARGTRIDGKPVVFQLLAQDDRGDPRAAALVADYLVKSGVAAVIGHWNTGASMSAGKIYSDAGIAQIAPGSTSRQYTQAKFRHAFRIVGHDDDGGIYASQYTVLNLRAKRVVVIDDDTAFGRTLADQFIKGLRERGLDVAMRQSVSSKTSDFNSVLSESKSKNADLIFFGGLGPQAATLMRNMRRMNLDARLLAADGTVGLTFLQLAGSDGEGALGLAPGQAQEKMSGWKKFIAAYDGQIEFFAPFAYDAANMIAAAVKQSNSTDPAQIAAALHTMKYAGLTGTISFDAEGNLNNPAYTIYQVQSGKWVPVQAFGGK